MPPSIRSSVLVAALTLLTPFTLAQQVLGPPSCGVPVAAAQATTRPPSPRPSADALQAVVDAETSDPSVLTASEPPNFQVARYRLQDYYDCVGSSGCYWADLDAQIRRADAELTRLLVAHNATTPADASAQKLAMVLDIDETSLTSYCEEKHEDFGYIPSMFEKWIVSPEASIPIPGTMRLFNHARAAGVSVFFITGRPGKGRDTDQTAATARNLATAGYKDWQGLMLHDSTYPTRETEIYKSDARAALLKQGYQILLNVGDQWSDLRDAADPLLPDRIASRAEMSVKLPNPFYYLP
jgi:HAD superfamily, subfamily IIIB (Acid phosphatase)